jgi:hypothetical protein
LAWSPCEKKTSLAFKWMILRPGPAFARNAAGSNVAVLIDVIANSFLKFDAQVLPLLSTKLLSL